MTDFYFVPPIIKRGRDLKASLILIDQFGNEHKLKTVFKSPEKPAPRLPEPPKESLDAIRDPIARDVASFLKAETQRYRACGRSVGGLGSIQTVFENRTFPGLAPEWREANSPLSRLILKPGEARITSDNADALLELCNRAIDDEENEKARFENAMLRRLSRDTEYAPVGYFILFVLLKVGKGAEALWKCRADLCLDGASGFNEVLRLLDGMLRAEHSSFSDELLDEIERFIEGLQERFRIPERIATIRACRLARAKLVS